MKITIDASENGATSLGTVSTKNAANIDNSAQKNANTTKYGHHYYLDISGNVMDNNAYAGHGKTAEDVMLEAGSQDIVARRNYMAVMSNTMSKEDFAKLQRDGIHPGNTEIGTVVTIIDHIKAALIKGGKEVHGYTDNMDAETFAAITGDKVMAEKLLKQFQEKGLPSSEENWASAGKAWEKARDITELSEGAVKYMVENNLSPTIENLYLAKYSGGNDAGKQGRGYFAQNLGSADGQAAYFAKKADRFDWDKLNPQIEKAVRDAGFEYNEKTRNSGRWLVEKGIPLTTDHLLALNQIHGLKLPQDKAEIASAIAGAISDGRNPLTANLLDPRSNMEKAVAYAANIKSIEPQAVEEVVLNEQILNLKNLFIAQRKIIHESNDRPSQSTNTAARFSQAAEAVPASSNNTAKNNNSGLNERIITAQRTLAEASLIMTATANIRLLRSGFSIETASLEQLVTRLKEAEVAIRSQLVGTKSENEAVTATRYSLYQDTLTKVNEISVMPAALIARMTRFTPAHLLPAAGTLNSINEIHATGTILQAAYEKAGEYYEQVKTAPRRDMGDSIQKAFRNVDDILTASNLALSDANRRAIRILGYNSMELSSENIDAVKEKDAQLQDILAKMKPGTVLNMIREGLNPLTMSLNELQDVLNGKNESIADALESYSHFLAKLDRKGDISKEERSVYIGIYRLLRQIEKGESRAVGSLIHAEMDFSLGNLLTAMRSFRRQGMDYRVNDDFGGVDAVHFGERLESSLEKLHQEMRSRVEPAMSEREAGVIDSESAMTDSETELRENLAAIIEKLKLAETDEAYHDLLLKDVQTLKSIDQNIIRSLLDSNQPITVNNLIAALSLLKKPGELHQKAKEQAKETNLDMVLTETKENLIRDFTDEDSAANAYDNLQKVMTDIFSRAAVKEQAATFDVKELSNMCRQINLISAMKSAQLKAADGRTYREERYDIPIEIDGEITAINLLIRHDSASTGKVSCAMNHAAFWAVTADFTVNNGKINGHVAVNNTEGLKKLDEKADNLYAALSDILEINDIHFIKSNVAETALLSSTLNNENKIINSSTEEQDKSMDAGKASNKELYLIAKAFITFIQRENGISNDA